MGTHRCHDCVLVSTLLSHGIVDGQSQDVSRFGVRVHHTFHQALREWRDSAQGHQSGPNDDWHEGKTAIVREAFCSRTGYHDRVPKPAAIEADRSCGDGLDHNSNLLSNSMLVLKHRCRANSST